MAPSNVFLEDDAVRQSIIAHDPQMVLKTGKAFGDGEFEIHYDLNGSRERVLLGELLAQYAEDGSLTSGQITLSSLAQTLWGRTDEPLERRLRGHFNPASQFNTSLPDGTLYMVNADGAVEGRNRHSEALRLVQARADRFGDQMARKAEREFKPLVRDLKRAKKIAPQANEELTEIATEAIQSTTERINQGQLALGDGS